MTISKRKLLPNAKSILKPIIGGYGMPKFCGENFRRWLKNREIRECFLPRKFSAVWYTMISIMLLPLCFRNVDCHIMHYMITICNGMAPGNGAWYLLYICMVYKHNISFKLPYFLEISPHLEIRLPSKCHRIYLPTRPNQRRPRNLAAW